MARLHCSDDSTNERVVFTAKHYPMSFLAAALTVSLWEVYVKYLHVGILSVYEVLSRSFRTGLPERELQVVQLSATRCSCIAIS
jgi:hypothetical protein